jgi:glycosyltransferase involved in cell wall biosynthesis
MRAVVLLCVRNEESLIAHCLDNWRESGCDVLLIDNDSEDRTVDIARKYLGHGLLSIERLPWTGCFQLREQLLIKKRLMRELDHDWVIHSDADEWLCSPWQDERLLDGIRRVDAEGFNCINFIELVFPPWPDQDFTFTNYTRRMKTYYFFAPSHPHRMQAWRRDLNVDNVEGAGHILRGTGIRLYKTDFIMRHYIALSVDHAVRKYVHRRYDPAELARGWSLNRVNITPERLALKPSHYLRRLDRWDTVDFDRSVPTVKHFWEWNLPDDELSAHVDGNRPNLASVLREGQESSNIHAGSGAVGEIRGKMEAGAIISDGEGDTSSEAATGRKCILVLGVHRSGTSAFARILNLLGAALPKHMSGANVANEAGFWEPERLVALHDEMLAAAGSSWRDWRAFDAISLGPERLVRYKTEIARIIAQDYGAAALFVIKDPRICRFVPLYEDVLSALRVIPLHVLPVRNPLAVVKSLICRDRMTVLFGSLLWLNHMLDAENATRGKTRIIVSYERLLDDWQGVASDISSDLGLAWPRPLQVATQEVQLFLSRALMHHSSSVDELAARGDITDWVKDAYRALLALEKDRGNKDSYATLDRIRSEIRAVTSILNQAWVDIAEQEQLSESRAKINSLESTLHALYASTSWRVTAPLRWARKFLNGLS